MSRSPYSQNCKDHYTNIGDVYPSVFALKMFMGRNPDLELIGTDFSGKSVLDVGFGDGRDLVLFHKLGFKVFGVEVEKHDLLLSGFHDCKVYDYDVDWFGTRETAFIFSACKPNSC